VDGLELHGGQGHGHTTIARGLVGCVACGICLGIAGFIRCPRGPRLGEGRDWGRSARAGVWPALGAAVGTDVARGVGTGRGADSHNGQFTTG
jgi:hypothetical protein